MLPQTTQTDNTDPVTYAAMSADAPDGSDLQGRLLDVALVKLHADEEAIQRLLIAQERHDISFFYANGWQVRAGDRSWTMPLALYLNRTEA